MGGSASKKTVCVTRIGAIGDMIITTPVYPLLKADGYKVIANTSIRGWEILKHNPYIDEFLEHDTSIPPDEQLTKHWENIKKGYDKFINLSGSIEGSLSKVSDRDDFYQDKEVLHKECNVNFYDRTLELAGYGHIKGQNGQLFFSPLEETLARGYRRKYKKKFLIMWVLSGSSPHKTWPWVEYTAKMFMSQHPDVVIMTVGEELCKLLEWSHPQTKCYSGLWGVRKTLIMTKYVDLVVGTDTGIMHGAGCFSTPKILLHSANTKENLSKYWLNCTDLSAGMKCQPCHRMHSTREFCNLDSKLLTPACMSKLKPDKVYVEMSRIYNIWKEKRRNKDGVYRIYGQPNFLH